jgi:hypothetical protein
MGELARPTPRETDLGVLCGDVGGSARGRPVNDLGVDLDDAAGPLGLHSGEDGSEQQYRALDEEPELRDVVRPGHLRQGRFRLRAGRVQYQHVDGAEAAGHRRDEIGNLPLVGDVGREGVRDSAVVPDGGDDLERLCVTVEAVYGNGPAIACETPGDGTAEPAQLPVTSETRCWSGGMRVIIPQSLVPGLKS